MIERTIVEADAIDCRLVAASWDFVLANASAIERHWERRRAKNPRLFDGRVLMLERGSIETVAPGRTVFRGTCFATDFKAFLAWREFGHPATTARNVFAMTVLETGDGAFVLGEMAPHTATAGWIYFPSGTPDLGDVRDGQVEIEGSAARELTEETGLTGDDVSILPGVTLVVDAVRVCCMKRVRVSESAVALVTRIEDWLSREPDPEFARMHVVRGPADLLPATPEFVRAYLLHRFAAG